MWDSTCKIIKKEKSDSILLKIKVLIVLYPIYFSFNITCAKQWLAIANLSGLLYYMWDTCS